ncbi:ssk1 response regulator receiver [Apophysomyces sp. BC1034]|nr:ssk1 response regulator receiver [Apophysomyces sp. BC1015]KAG0180140.1 ssk1 response regulator receiver [Apophysomyces sp. BC1021]KAG0189785.1 ssk1 response regulator receiver [Apophysomyces sp. BC1034]
MTDPTRRRTLPVNNVMRDYDSQESIPSDFLRIPQEAAENAFLASGTMSLHDESQPERMDRSPSLSRLSSDEWVPRCHMQRPQLSYLRSVWASQDLRIGRIEGMPFSIRLPPIQLHDPDDDTDDEAVAREVHHVVTAAVWTCLSCAAGGTALVFQSPAIDDKAWMQRSFQPLLIVWWSLMTVTWAKRPESAQLYLSWAQHSALLMAAVTFMIPYLFDTQPATYWPLICLEIFSVCLFYISHRIERADGKQKQHIHQRGVNEHGLLQRLVDGAVEDYADRQVTFLSTVSREVQDAALMVITTLEQFSPATILANTHELLSACSIAVPIASISAIHTTIKQVCHVSSQLALLQKLTYETSATMTTYSDIRQEFDVGELVQNVGDALAGMAAKIGVNIVIYHSDNGLHHTNVIGDEGAMRHGLLNLLRNILEGCTPGASIELGLNITPTKASRKLGIALEIIHTTSPAIPEGLNPALLPNANLTAQLLQYIGGSLAVDDLSKNRTRFEVKLEMETGQNNDNQRLLLIRDPSLVLHKHYANTKFSNEPTLKELNKFIESLKGLKMVLHAPEHSVFAKHLTSCLASWNTDISHVPVARLAEAHEDEAASSDDATANSETNASVSSLGNRSAHESIVSTSSDLHTASPRPASTPPVPSPAIEEEHLHSIPPAFILIDDDIVTLERKLREFRSQPPASVNVLQNHQYIRRHKHNKSGVPHQNFFHQGTTAIIHFTSLTNYKRVRDSVQWFATSPMPPFSMPRVVVVPKPAGPRRFLTALHTAYNNAVVEPHFLPIATSPTSPQPPTMSMMVQRDTPLTPGGTPETHRGSPGDAPSAGRRRPMSGIYSPPATLAENISETSNYFGDHSRSSSAAAMSLSASSGVQGSPFEGGGIRMTANRNILGQNRRRSHTELGAPTQQPVNDYWSSGSGSGAYGQVSPGGSSLKFAHNAPSTPPKHQEVSPVPCHGNIGPCASSENQTTTIVEETGPDHDAAPISPGGTTAEGSERMTKKPLMRTMSNFKLSKKKKKGKTPFAGVVSPPINVLIVEDNMINQAILSAWMKKHKIKFSVASNGQEAVEKWQGGHFHLVLMDIQLPVMDGIEATKTIRKIEKEKKIGVLPMSSSFLRQQAAAAADPNFTEDADLATSSELPEEGDELPPSTFRSPVIIVALTASSLESDRHAALAAGCNDFLTKPVSLEWLEKKIIEWGCMQALIDFEGWRQWKQSSSAEPTLPLRKKENDLQAEEEKRRIIELSNAARKSPNGVVLPGAMGMSKQRRFSTFDRKPNSPALRRGKLTKSGSDPNLLGTKQQKKIQDDAAQPK